MLSHGELAAPPAQVLKRTLCPKAAVPYLELKLQRIHRETGIRQDSMRAIGLGSCGSVFESEAGLAVKKGSNAMSMWHDFCFTNYANAAFKDTHTLLQQAFPSMTIPCVPQCFDFHLPDSDDYWSEILRRFPESHRSKQPLFTVDRILPLPLQTRTALIESYFAESMQQEAKNDFDNTDCLARIYLGEREAERHQRDSYDSLRNFPLRLDMLIDLGIDVAKLATEMAIGLAILHWHARLDAMDSEFVLGSATGEDQHYLRGYCDVSRPPHSVKVPVLQRRAVHMWMLDFDKASQIKLTSHDVEKKLVPAFLGNDAYFPRPDVDEDLWIEFCEAYSRASEAILQNKGVGKNILGLPQLFLGTVEEMIEADESWSAEQNIIFG